MPFHLYQPLVAEGNPNISANNTSNNPIVANKRVLDKLKTINNFDFSKNYKNNNNNNFNPNINTNKSFDKKRSYSKE